MRYIAHKDGEREQSIKEHLEGTAERAGEFAEYGEVSSAKVIFDRETGRSRGFAFVEMTNDAEGQKAIDELNGVEYDQKVISVSVARPRAEKPSYGGNRGGGYNNSRRY